MPNALITGAAGFLGFHLATRLRAEGRFSVIGADRRREPLDPDLFTDYVTADCADEAQAVALIRRTKPQAVFHLAGAASGPDGAMFAANLMASIHMLEAVRLHAPAAAVLLVGSAAEYGVVAPDRLPIDEEQACMPRGAYGISKHAMTMAVLDYVRRFGLKALVIRPFNIVGAGVPPNLVVGALLGRIRERLEEGAGSIRVGNLDTQRDFIAVEDVVDGCLRLIQADCWGHIFNLCSGVPRSIRSIVEILFHEFGCSLPLEVDQTLIRPDDVKISYGSWRKAAAAVGFKPESDIESALRAASRAAVNDNKNAKINGVIS